MTVWVIHQQLTAEEELHIQQRTHLVLPFDGLPDLTAITQPHQARKLLSLLYPQEPPEAITMRLDNFWSRYRGLHSEDIIAVPLPEKGKVALAEVTGPYGYRVGENGADIHLIPVKWYEKQIPLRKFRKHKDLFKGRKEKMYEVADAEARTAIREELPYKYNRFRRWKWLLGFFFVLNLLRYIQRSF